MRTDRRQTPFRHRRRRRRHRRLQLSTMAATTRAPSTQIWSGPQEVLPI